MTQIFLPDGNVIFLAIGIGGKKRKKTEQNQWARDLNVLEKERAFPSNHHESIFQATLSCFTCQHVKSPICWPFAKALQTAWN